MVRFTGGVLLFSAFSAAAPAPAEQVPLLVPTRQQSFHPSQSVEFLRTASRRKLQGRFLHITDVHPDPFYTAGRSPDGDHPCHKEAGKGSSGYYGAEASDCDTPFSLVNATFQWIKDNIKDDIDFVIWTGDSARHDNDESYPRTEKQVTELNEFVVSKFVETFSKDDNKDDRNPTNDFIVPIVPTFGNNDILPHNIFLPGPNRWTRKYEDIWEKFVPQEQKHSFARGGWFFSEVIPNRLAVISLNTLYFFDSNAAVDGCDAKSEPGYEHMEWLRIQLQFLRQRDMKAILIGHVPPARTSSKQSWDESCYQKYTLWMRQYRDVVLSSIWGHMNIDHFMFQDVKDLTYKFDIDGVDDEFGRNSLFKSESNHPVFTIADKTSYLNELRDSWSQLPRPPKGTSYTTTEGDDLESETIKKKKKKKKKSKKEIRKEFLKKIGGPYGERFSLGLVSPSVVPNFFPTLRIVEYNITGLEKDHPADGAIGVPADLEDIIAQDPQSSETFEEEMTDDVSTEKKKKKSSKKHKSKKKPKKPKFPVPEPPSKTAGPGPAYSPQSLSLLSWTQLYANLTTINAAVKADDFHNFDDSEEVLAKQKHKHFKYEVEYSTKNDSVYDMRDLTVRSWLELAERIGRGIKSGGSDVKGCEEKSEFDDEVSSDLEEDTVDTEDDTEEGSESDDESESDSDDDIHPSKKHSKANKHHKKNKKHKKKKGKKKRKLRNLVWKTFITRVFVGTKPDGDLDDDFGRPIHEDGCDC